MTTLRVVHSTYERFSASQRSVDADVTYSVGLDGRLLCRRRVDAGTRRLILTQFYQQFEGMDRASAVGTADLERLRASGRWLADILFTEEALGRIWSIEPESPLVIDTTDADVPWELLFHQGKFLAERYAPVRQHVAGSAHGHRDQRGVGIFVIADPRGDLPAARSEASALLALFAQSAERLRRRFDCSVRIRSLIGAEASKQAVLLSVLLSDEESIDILHYAGHVEYDSSDPERASLELTDGSLKAFEVSRMRHSPVVFLNGCKSSSLDAGTEVPTIGLLSGLAGEFLAAGARGYIGTLWAVDDDVAAAVAHDIYDSMLNGNTLAEAVRSARTSQTSAGNVDGLAYLAFGTAETRLPPFATALTAGPFVNEEGVLRIIDLERKYPGAELLVVNDLPWVLWSLDDITTWVSRLPVSEEERIRIGARLTEYRDKFGSLVASGDRVLECVVSHKNLKVYLDEVSDIRRGELGRDIERLAAQGGMRLLLDGSPVELEELELICAQRNWQDSEDPAEWLYVFNKQTRLESDRLRYHLFTESSPDLIEEYRERFLAVRHRAARFTATLGRRHGIEVRFDDAGFPSPQTVVELLRLVAEAGRRGRD